jgi:uncharacterized protein YceK
MKKLVIALVVAALSLAGCGGKKASISSKPSHSDAAIQAFLDAPDAPDAAAKLVAAGVPPLDALKAVRNGRKYADVQKGFFADNVKVTDDLELAFGAVVPDDYDPAVKTPVLMVLHGGVSTPTPYPTDRLGKMAEEFASLVGDGARKPIAIAPQGCSRSMWWTMNGRAAILGSLRKVAETCNIDYDRVFVTGFSDGASACWFLAGADPTPSRGFLPSTECRSSLRWAG